MIDMDLIELQKDCKASCAVILTEDCEKLNNNLVVNANVQDSELLKVLKENKELDYFVVSEIDKVDKDIQNKYYHIVKDREFFGIELPEDTVIVFTVSDRDGLKLISQELYNFCVVAF